MQWAQKQKGFTIVELLIVIVVIAILAAITIVAYNGITNSAREAALNSSLKQASTAVTTDYLANAQTYPATLTGVSNSGGTTYQYTPNNNSPVKSFCITATSNGVSKHLAGFSGGINKMVNGPCPGHTGTQATLIADCPAGYITVPGSSLFNTDSFCVMKYEAKNSGGVATSVAAGTPWANITQVNALAAGTAACSGCHLISENEWLTIAQNIIHVGSNWSSGTVGSGSLFKGHSDGDPTTPQAASTSDTAGYVNIVNTSGDQRRTFTLSNGQVIWDFAGNIREFTQETITDGQPGSAGASWTDWTSTAVLNNYGSVPHIAPVYAHPAAGSWTPAQNIGRLYSDSSSTAIRAYLRGGGAGDSGSSNAGIYSTIFNISEATANSTSGFRVAR